MNTGAKEMAWFFDEYSKFKGFSPGVVTGKVTRRTLVAVVNGAISLCLIIAANSSASRRASSPAR